MLLHIYIYTVYVHSICRFQNTTRFTIKVLILFLYIYIFIYICQMVYIQHHVYNEQKAGGQRNKMCTACHLQADTCNSLRHLCHDKQMDKVKVTGCRGDVTDTEVTTQRKT